jgi:hypothetical protein
MWSGELGYYTPEVYERKKRAAMLKREFAEEARAAKERREKGGYHPNL